LLVVPRRHLHFAARSSHSHPSRVLLCCLLAMSQPTAPPQDPHVSFHVPSGVFVHPKDFGPDTGDLNSIFVHEDPEEFVPRVDPVSGAVLCWGIEDGTDEQHARWALPTGDVLIAQRDRCDHNQRLYGTHAKDHAWYDQELKWRRKFPSTTSTCYTMCVCNVTRQSFLYCKMSFGGVAAPVCFDPPACSKPDAMQGGGGCFGTLRLLVLIIYDNIVLVLQSSKRMPLHPSESLHRGSTSSLPSSSSSPCRRGRSEPPSPPFAPATSEGNMTSQGTT
jgi:hypothetical protein